MLPILNGFLGKDSDSHHGKHYHNSGYHTTLKTTQKAPSMTSRGSLHVAGTETSPT